VVTSEDSWVISQSCRFTSLAVRSTRQRSAIVVGAALRTGPVDQPWSTPVSTPPRPATCRGRRPCCTARTPASSHFRRLSPRPGKIAPSKLVAPSKLRSGHQVSVQQRPAAELCIADHGRRGHPLRRAIRPGFSGRTAMLGPFNEHGELASREAKTGQQAQPVNAV